MPTLRRVLAFSRMSATRWKQPSQRVRFICILRKHAAVGCELAPSIANTFVDNVGTAIPSLQVIRAGKPVDCEHGCFQTRAATTSPRSGPAQAAFCSPAHLCSSYSLRSRL